METRYFSDPAERFVIGFSGSSESIVHLEWKLKTLAQRSAKKHPAFDKLTSKDHKIWLTFIYDVITQRFRTELDQAGWMRHLLWKPDGIFADSIRAELAFSLGKIIDGTLDFALRPLASKLRESGEISHQKRTDFTDSERADLNKFFLFAPGLEEVTLFLPAPERAAV